MEKILKKICDYLDYVIKELEKNNLSILFDCRDTIYSMCFNGNSLKDIFIEIIPTEKLNRFNKSFPICRTIDFWQTGLHLSSAVPVDVLV